MRRVRSNAVVTMSSFGAMFTLGVAASLVGSAARNIGLAATQIGVLLAVQNLGFMAGVAVAGALADRGGKTTILAAGSALLVVAFATFYLSPFFVVNLAIIFCIGLGTGSYEGVTDAMLMEIHPRRRTLYVNINHFFVTIGALAITLYLIFLQMRWRASMVQISILAGVLAVVFAVTRPGSHGAAPSAEGPGIGSLLRRRGMAPLFIITIAAVGNELGIIGVLTTFLMTARGFSQVTSKIALAVFLAAIATGRVLVGFLVSDHRLRRLNAVLFAATGCSTVALWLAPWTPAIYILVFAAGLSLSALLPTIIARTGMLFPDAPATALGLVKIAIPLGGVLIPLAFSGVVRFTALLPAMFIFPTLALVGFIFVWLPQEDKPCS